MLQSISVGIDSSGTSAEALAWADHLATETGATLRAIQAWETPQKHVFGPLIPSVSSEESLEQECRETLSRVVAQSDIVGDPERVIRQGRSGQVLVDVAETDDLLVLGRTGWGCRRLASMVLGSTTRHVINNANVAVAVVPRKYQWVDSPKVFVGIDGSFSSCEALRWAVTNLPASAEIHAVWALTYWSEALISADMELFHHASDAVLPELARCIAIATDHDATAHARVTPRVEPGSPRRVFTSTEPGMDIVVVGKHGSSGTTAPIIGSVADHLVRHAPCPVIVVP